MFALGGKIEASVPKKRLLLFKTVIFPMMTYVSEIWFGHLFQNSNVKLDSLQYEFLKHANQVFNSVFYSVTHVMASTPML